MTEDLDAVVACFARIKDTISNISILGDYVPEHEHFRHRLMLVFTSMLEFCGFAETLFSKHSKACKRGITVELLRPPNSNVRHVFQDARIGEKSKGLR